MASMDWDDYLRQEASMYRQLAEKTENVFGKQEFLDLAAVCEEVANSIEDRLTGGVASEIFLVKAPLSALPASPHQSRAEVERHCQGHWLQRVVGVWLYGRLPATLDPKG